MIKVLKLAGNRFQVTYHEYSKSSNMWKSYTSWENVGPVGLEAYLERRQVESMDVKAALSAMLNRNFSIAIFNKKGTLEFLL